MAGAAEEAAAASVEVDPFKPVIDDILRTGSGCAAETAAYGEADLDRLLDVPAKVDVLYQVVRAYVAVRAAR